MANQEPSIVVRGRTDAKHWNAVETGRGVVVRWRRLIGNLHVEFGGRLLATLSANATFATLPKKPWSMWPRPLSKYAGIRRLVVRQLRDA